MFPETEALKKENEGCEQARKLLMVGWLIFKSMVEENLPFVRLLSALVICGLIMETPWGLWYPGSEMVPQKCLWEDDWLGWLTHR